MIFLEDLSLLTASDVSPDALGSGFLGLLMAALAVVLVVGIIIWIYTSLAFMAIARKAKQSSPGIAWIPGIGPAIIAYRASGMHWWPWLLLIGFFIPILNILAQLVFLVYLIIWTWKLFEKINKPGWWAILYLVPIVNLIVIGIAAWSKD